MAPHKWRYPWQVDLVVFADDIGQQMLVQTNAALRANRRTMINRRIRGIVQGSAMTLVAGLRPSRLGVITAGFPVRRGRLRRCLRRLGRALQSVITHPPF